MLWHESVRWNYLPLFTSTARIQFKHGVWASSFGRGEGSGKHCQMQLPMFR